MREQQRVKILLLQPSELIKDVQLGLECFHDKVKDSTTVSERLSLPKTDHRAPCYLLYEHRPPGQPGVIHHTGSWSEHHLTPHE